MCSCCSAQTGLTPGKPVCGLSGDLVPAHPVWSAIGLTPDHLPVCCPAGCLLTYRKQLRKVRSSWKTWQRRAKDEPSHKQKSRDSQLQPDDDSSEGTDCNSPSLQAPLLLPGSPARNLKRRKFKKNFLISDRPFDSNPSGQQPLQGFLEQL